MWPRNLLWKTCYSTLVQINERRFDSSIIQTRSADRSIDRFQRVNEHASDIKTASGLADALSRRNSCPSFETASSFGRQMSLYTRLLERTVYATTLGTHEIDTGPRRRKKMTETMKRLEVDSRNGKITKRITATRPRDEIKKRTRDGVIWKNWTFAVVEGHEVFFFFGEIVPPCVPRKSFPFSPFSIETVAIVRRAPMDSPREPRSIPLPPTHPPFPLPSSFPPRFSRPTNVRCFPT